MTDERVFSWAEDVNGNMVHVDSVARGLKCNCFYEDEPDTKLELFFYGVRAIKQWILHHVFKKNIIFSYIYLPF